jgi:hypothetical protein
MANGFTMDVSSISNKLGDIGKRFDAAMQMKCSTAANQLESYAKENRPWTDRTGHARQRLKGSFGSEGQNNYRIVLAQCVDYGLWLELAHEKKYAIVEPTIRLQSQEIFNDFQDFFSKLQ